MGGRVASERGRAEGGDGGRQRPSGSPKQLASLTPLRGIAALWVVIFHFCWYFPAVHPERYTGVVYKGYLAVDMFFVLSGFVITHVYKEGFARRVTGRRYRDFLKARVARIYPLHITVLLMFVATASAERAASYALRGSFEPIPLLGERSLGGFIANLVMLQGLWARELSWNDPAWSISLEFLAYFLFPLLFPVLWRAGPAAKAGFGGLLVVALGWLAYRTGGYFNQWNGTYAILRCLPEFLAGMLLYSVYQSGNFASVLASDAALAAIALLLAALLHLAAPDLAIIPLFPLLILAAVRNTGRLVAAAEFSAANVAGRHLLFPLPAALVRAVRRDRNRATAAGSRLREPAARTLARPDHGVDLSQPCSRDAQLSIIEVTGRRWLRQRLDVGRPVAVIGVASAR